MPTAFLVALTLSLLLCGQAAADGRCFHKDRPFGKAEPIDGPAEGPVEGCSSFRGIGLANRPEEVRRIAHALGFDTGTSYFVGDKTAVAGVDICKDGEGIGRADFDRQGRMLRLSLKDRFFSDKRIFVRDFADELFERYDVRPTKVADDVCFQDVTCFKGRSKYGEQFLIMRFGIEAELFVKPDIR